jgi:hypothetical protein
MGMFRTYAGIAQENGLFSMGMMTRLSGRGRGTGIALGDAEVGERHLSITRKTIYTLVGAGLLRLE